MNCSEYSFRVDAQNVKAGHTLATKPDHCLTFNRLHHEASRRLMGVLNLFAYDLTDNIAYPCTLPAHYKGERPEHAGKPCCDFLSLAISLGTWYNTCLKAHGLNSLPSKDLQTNDWLNQHFPINIESFLQRIDDDLVINSLRKHPIHLIYGALVTSTGAGIGANLFVYEDSSIFKVAISPKFLARCATLAVRFGVYQQIWNVSSEGNLAGATAFKQHFHERDGGNNDPSLVVYLKRYIDLFLKCMIS